MKKKVLAGLASLCMMLGGVNVMADEAKNVSIFINGNELLTDTAPIIVDGRTLVPVRAIAEGLWCDVSWDQQTQCVSIFDQSYMYNLWIGKDTAFKNNGVALEGHYIMDVMPQIVNDRTLIPIRCISELMGAEVNWNEADRRVEINYQLPEVKIPDGSCEEFLVYTQAMTAYYEVYRDFVTDKNYTVDAIIELENGGQIGLELYYGIAPNSVINFVSLAQNGAFDGKIFHRVIKDFMIQGGAIDPSGQAYESEPIDGEFVANGYFNLLSHKRGVISMARTNEYNSGSNQFFIMHADSQHLDGQYAAFGCVTSGMEYVDAIATVETDESDIPLENQVIKTVKIITQI